VDEGCHSIIRVRLGFQPSASPSSGRRAEIEQDRPASLFGLTQSGIDVLTPLNCHQPDFTAAAKEEWRYHCGLKTPIALFATFISIFVTSGFAQVPQVAANGVLNAASWSSPVSPGALAAVFGSNLASKQESATPPYPAALGGTTVTINGTAAPLLFASPGQINFQMPSALANSEWFNVSSATIVVTTAAGSSAPVEFGLASLPGLFTADGSGCGQAAALNIRADGSVSVNSPTNSATPGDYVALYGTGFGFSATQPPDGTAAAGAAALQTMPGVTVDQNLTASIAYAGLAPTLAGVDQINLQVPAATRNGCAVPVLASAGLGGPAATIAVESSGGKCTDPPIQSYGQILLSKSTNSGPLGTTTISQENLFAMFPSGPLFQPPAAQAVVFAPDYATSLNTIGAKAIEAAFPLNIRQCTIPGYSHLSAGTIQIQPPSGDPVAVNPSALNDGVSYGQQLPEGFIGPGTYTISGSTGAGVSLKTNLQVGASIQLQTTFPAGTRISMSQPLTVKWTGGDANSVVRLTLTGSQSIYAYAHATDGELTIQPKCRVLTGCSFPLDPMQGAQLRVDVLPTNPQRTSAPGVSGPVQVSWIYSYTFAGLTLGN
jgi:uncharacterized protein (TIGR03437 family)